MVTVPEKPIPEDFSQQIDEYVVALCEDSKGNLWFGTLSKGVAKYDGKKLIYITPEDGLPSERVVSIIEDKQGVLWFGTGAGLSSFDGNKFKNYSTKDGLCSDMISNLFIDSKGIFWIGTWAGVCTFDGKQFKDFPLPYPQVDTRINQDTKDWITEITEDKNGHIWFGRDGFGATVYDGQTLRSVTFKEGLNSNNVQAIREDFVGNIWIGTRIAERDNIDTNKRSGQGGLNKYDGKTWQHFPGIEGLTEGEIYGLYSDPQQNVWIGTVKNGVYKYTNGQFKHYAVPKSTVAFLKDKRNNLWLACAGGLYKISPKGDIVNVTINGPWN